MIEVDLKAGDVFIWQNYPLFMDKEKPQRWLLFLGYNSVQAVVYEITTTTQFQYYTDGGSRAKNIFFKIPAGMGGLDKESILDLASFEEIPEIVFNTYKADIEKKGTLTQDYINRFVKFLKKAPNIAKIIQKDICGYLRDAGFKVT